MRIFLSFNSKDAALAEALRDGLRRLDPSAEVLLSPVSLGAGMWLPKLAEEIAAAQAFLLLVTARNYPLGYALTDVFQSLKIESARVDFRQRT